MEELPNEKDGKPITAEKYLKKADRNRKGFYNRIRTGCSEYIAHEIITLKLKKEPTKPRDQIIDELLYFTTNIKQMNLYMKNIVEHPEQYNYYEFPGKKYLAVLKEEAGEERNMYI